MHHITEQDNVAIFNNSPIPIFITGLDGSILRVNLQWAEFTGYSISESENGMKIADITHPADIDGNSEALKLFKSDESILYYNWTKRYISKNGKVKWAEIHMYAIREENGNLLHIINTLVPLPNGGKFIVEKTDNEITVRPTITMVQFMRDNWKWFIAAGIAITFFVAKLVSTMALVLDKLEIPW